MRRSIPFWRDVRVLRVFSQILFVAIVALLAGFLYANLSQAMAKRGLTSGFGFLQLEAGFEIGETPIPYAPGDTYGRAYLVGVLNTLKVSLIGIVLATVVGLVAGVGRLSSNWLIRQITSAYIEVIRNTPLLVQLFFWYSAVIYQFPAIKSSIRLPGGIFLSKRGVALPWLRPTGTFRFWLLFLFGGIAAAIVLWVWRRRYQERSGKPGYAGFMSLGAVLVPSLAGWFLVGQRPLRPDVPEIQGFRFIGGTYMTPEYAALLIGLVVYTAAFIAEVVRGGIISVRKGQIEAGRSLGLTEMQSLRLIVFPQALRIIVPPLTSQYLNLAKNSSLAIAVGFPDLFNVSKTILNQTGRPVPVVILMMASYLTMSLLTSLLMNIYNRRIRFLET